MPTRTYRQSETTPHPSIMQCESGIARTGETVKLSSSDPYPIDFYARPVVTVAQELLGSLVVRTLDSEIVTARIVETEAYSAESDQASHSYRGRTARNATMFGDAGRAYIYLSYGVHNMFNVVTTRESGPASAVLIRGMEVVRWSDFLLRARPNSAPGAILRGPGNICAALGITRGFDGHNLAVPPLQIARGVSTPEPIVVTTRIGITKSAELPWRFYLLGSPAVSRRDRAAETALNAKGS